MNNFTNAQSISANAHTTLLDLLEDFKIRAQSSLSPFANLG